MNLFDLIDNTLTDKNTSHSYLDFYQSVFESKKDSSKYVLEVGIGDFTEKNGGSIKLWRDYFQNATIYGIDILPKSRVLDELLDNPRVKIFTEANAYSDDFFNKNIKSLGVKFDILIDDGPHTLESMVRFLELYTTVLADDGVLIIEDIPNIKWLEALYDFTPEKLKPFAGAFDLRHVKGRFDDLLFFIQNNKLAPKNQN